jgi:hypothetical protein
MLFSVSQLWPSSWLGDILHNREAIGRMAKRSVEHREFDIHFVSRTAIKPQVQVDFVDRMVKPCV